MKTFFFLLSLTFLSFTTEKSFSQEKVNIDADKVVSVDEVFNIIQKQTKYRFIYPQDLFLKMPKVKLRKGEIEVSKLLSQTLVGGNFNFKLSGNNSIIINKNKPDDNLNITKAQKRRISGKITNQTGLPLAGANILEKGTNNSTTSNFDGNFSIDVDNENSILVVSYVGFENQDINIKGQTVVNVTLKESIGSLKDIVVVGYGTQKKTKVTAAISTIKLEKIAEARPITDIGSAIQGLSSGVSVTQSSGNPNSSSIIRIRGYGSLNDSTPLVLVDGLVVSDINSVNPHDIATVTILKDAAAAAIYGARSAHGVILITTKKGNGKKLTVTLGSMTSFAKPIATPKLQSDYATVMRLNNESYTNTGAAAQFTAAEINRWDQAKLDPYGLNSNGVPNYIASPSTDWIKTIYHEDVVTDTNLSINGSSENTRYLVSGQIINNSGLVDNTGVKRYNFRVNFEVDASKWLTVGTRVFSETKKLGMVDFGNIEPYLVTTPGVYPYYNGDFGAPELAQAPGGSVLAFLNDRFGNRTNTTLNAAFYTKAKIVNGLTWDLNYNYIKGFSESNSYTNPKIARQVRFSDGTVSVPSGRSPGNQNLITDFSNNSSNRQVFESILRYDKNFGGKHDLGIIAGYNQTKFYSFATSASMKGLVDPVAWAPSAATTMNSISGSDSDWSTQSFFGRATYMFDKRYILEGSFRRDGSSHFAEESRYGFFPSVSAGWVITGENFMKNQNVFNYLKLRGSWGKLGSDVSGNYDYMSKYGTVDYVLGGQQVTGLRISKIANNELQWESIESRNIGLEAEFLDRRLSIETDLYEKISSNILDTPAIYLTMGTAGAPTVNGASVSNKGVEFNASWADRVGQLNYRISGNFTYNIDKVIKYRGTLQEGWTTDANGNPIYSSNIGQASSGGTQKVLEGHRSNEFYLLNLYSGDGSHVGPNGGPKDGMIRTPEDMAWINQMVADGNKFMPSQAIGKNKIWYGDFIYADTNGDKIYGNSFDNVFTGISDRPKYLFGSQMECSWKNFSLNLIWAGQACVKKYFLTSVNSPNVNVNANTGQAIGEHYYYNDTNPSDPNNNIDAASPRLTNAGGQSTAASTHWLYDASYLRLKNITLSYSIPIKNQSFIQGVRLYASGENLLTFTSYPGVDPEMPNSSIGYPIYKQVAIGANITF